MVNADQRRLESAFSIQYSSHCLRLSDQRGCNGRWRILRPRCASRDDAHCRFAIECRQIEKSADTVHIEQMCLVGSPRETHSDYRRFREQLIPLPGFERKRHEYFVFADYQVWLEQSRDHKGIAEAYRIPCLDSETREKSREMVGQIRMASNA